MGTKCYDDDNGTSYKNRNHHHVRLRSISNKRRYDDEGMVHHHQHHHHHHRSSCGYSKRVKKTDPSSIYRNRVKSSCTAKVEKDRPNYTTWKKRRLHRRSTESIVTSHEKKTSSTELEAIRDKQEKERKMQIQREREAARIALDKMVKTVDLEDNMAVMREYGKLVGHLEFSLSTPSHSCSRTCHYIHALHFDF